MAGASDDKDHPAAADRATEAHRSRLAAFGQVAAGVAHDLNNLLQSVLTNAELLQRTRLPPDQAQRVQAIVEEAQKGNELLKRILEFSRPWVSTRRQLDLGAVLEEFVSERRSGLPRGVRLELAKQAEACPVLGDRAQLGRTMDNLLANATEAMPEGGDLRIVLSTVVASADQPPPVTGMPDGTWARIAVSDSGTGIAPGDRPHIFEAFFTRKEGQTGAGLGLAEVRGVVEQHGGYISVESEPGKGTTVAVYLPRLEASRPGVGAEPARAAARAGRTTILVADDDPVVLSIIADALVAVGHRVLRAANGREAIALYERSGDDVDLVLVDLVMPGPGGLDVLAQVRQKNPDARVVLMSGYAAGGVDDPRAEDAFAWLQKPFRIETLTAAVRGAIEGAPRPATRP